MSLTTDTSLETLDEKRVEREAYVDQSEHEDDIELNRSQPRLVDVEVAMREGSKRKKRDRPRQREGRRDRRGEVVTALRARGRIAPRDTRGRRAIDDDGLAGLTSGHGIDRVAPAPANG